MQMTRMLLPLVLLLCTTAWGADEKEITVKLTVPDAAWAIAIDEVHSVGNELLIISTVSRNPDLMGAQVISTVQASLKLAAPDLPLRYFVIGKTWVSHTIVPVNGARKSVIIVFTIEFYFRIEHCRFRKVCC
jgi:hypothetical protein